MDLPVLSPAPLLLPQRVLHLSPNFMFIFSFTKSILCYPYGNVWKIIYWDVVKPTNGYPQNS